MFAPTFCTNGVFTNIIFFLIRAQSFILRLHLHYTTFKSSEEEILYVFLFLIRWEGHDEPVFIWDLLKGDLVEVW